MQLFNNLRLAAKIPLVLCALALAALLVMGYSSYVLARKALLDEGETRLETARDARQADIQAWAAVIESDIRAQAASPLALRALRDFESAWKRIGKDQGAFLTKRYVTDNPNPAGKRYLLEASADVSDYSIAHARYHKGFVAVFEEKGFQDILLVSESGEVLYSVMKESDFGQNVFLGPLRNSGLAKAARQAVQGREAAVVMTDLEFYEPSGDSATFFLSSPLKSVDGRVIGALVFQVPVAKLDAIVERSSGLGATGLIYLAGKDHRLRTNLASKENEVALRLRSDGEALKRALGGQSGTLHAAGLFGAPSVTAYGAVDMFGHSYGLIVEQSQAEMLAPVGLLARRMIGVGVLSICIVMAMAFLIARSLSRPLIRTAGTMAAIAGGDLSVPVTDATRKDEVGVIARGLEAFRCSLEASAASARDGAFKGAALAGSSAALMITDCAFKVTYVNHSAQRLVGAHVDSLDPGATKEKVDLLGQSLSGMHPALAQLCEVLATSQSLPYRCEIGIGAARVAIDANEVVMSEHGRIGFVLEWRDVTQERMNRAVLDAIDRSLVTAEFDNSGKLVTLNENMRDLLGIDGSARTQMQHSDVIRSAQGISGPAIWGRLVNAEPVYGQFEMSCGPGRASVVDGGFSPVFDLDGALLKVVFMATDVTEAQLELRRAEDLRRVMETALSEVVESLRVGLRDLSEGDLTVRIDKTFATEFETLRADFNMAGERLSEAMSAVIANAAAIGEEVNEITAAAEDLSVRTERQAATLEETAAALDELTESVQSAAHGAADASRMVKSARAAAEVSGGVVMQAIAAMDEIESSSARIARITGVIDDIAFQTNILALNAGVEAARAGDAGRGFAVVAAEVRALAQRSSDAAREIDELVTASSGHVKRGAGLVVQTGSVLGDILSSIGSIAFRVDEIAASAQEQSTGLGEINIAVNQVDQVTQQNAAVYSQTTAAGQALARGAIELSATMARFRVGAVQNPTPQRPAGIRLASDRVDLPAPTAGPQREIRTAARSRLRLARFDAESWEDF